MEFLNKPCCEFDEPIVLSEEEMTELDGGICFFWTRCIPFKDWAGQCHTKCPTNAAL